MSAAIIALFNSMRISLELAADSARAANKFQLAADLVDLAGKLKDWIDLGNDLEDALRDPDQNAQLREIVEAIVNHAAGFGIAAGVTAGVAVVGISLGAAAPLAIAIGAFVIGEALDEVVDRLAAAGITLVPIKVDYTNSSRPVEIYGTIVDDDIKTSQHGGDKVFAGAGADTIAQVGGSDEIDGGIGTDTVRYQSGQIIVDVDGPGRISVGHSSGTDNLKDVEIIEGGAANDVFTLGDAGVVNGVTFRGGAGEDRFAIRGPNGKIEGGADVDTIHFYDMAGDTGQINLRDGFAQSSSGGQFLVSGIENIIGSSKNNGLIGNNEKNKIDGGDGVDFIQGEGGDDILIGGDKADQIHGGDGIDTLYNGREGGSDDGVSDRLAGDAGKDIYYAGAGDIINDTDGSGIIYFNGMRLRGPKEPPEPACEEEMTEEQKNYETAEGVLGHNGERYKQSGGTVTVTMNGSTLTVEKFKNKDFGWIFPEEEDTNNSKDQSECKSDPIVIDLDRDGVEFKTLDDASAYFDMDGDDFRERTAWASGDDGILALDINGNGKIDEANEIFAGSGAVGFAALGLLDDNGDGVIDAADAVFGNLRVWRDANEDGVSDEGEVRSLADHGIVGIGLNGEVPVGQDRFPNADVEIVKKSTVWLADGSDLESAAGILRYNSHLTLSEGDVDPALADLPYLNGYGKLRDLDIAMTQDPELAARVRALDELTVENAGAFAALVEDIIVKWHRVADVLADTRGSFVDSQHLAALEVLFGQGFLNTAVFGNQSSPRAEAGSLLQSGWNNYFSNVAARLLAQSELGEALFPELSYEGAVSLVVLPATSITTVMERMRDAQPADPLAKITFWKGMISALDAVRDQFVESGAYFEFAADAVLVGADVGLTYAQLRTAQVASSEGDVLTGAVTDGFTTSGLVDDVLISGEGDDIFRDAGGVTTIIYGAGQGDDVFLANPQTQATIRLVGLNPGDVELTTLEGRLGYDAVLTITATGETLVIDGGLRRGSVDAAIWLEFEDGTRLQIGQDIQPETEQATDGNDNIFGTAADEELDGGAGDDFLAGGGGSDVYVIGPDSGNDTISETGGTGTDTIRFDADLRNVWFRQSGNDVVAKIGTTSVTIQNFSGGAVERFIFNDQTLSFADLNTIVEARERIIEGTDGNDTLRSDDSYFNTNILVGGLGNDNLIGDFSADRYVFDRGDGADIILDDGGASFHYGVFQNPDSVVIHGYSINEVVLSRVNDQNDDLVLTLGNNGDRITVRDTLETRKLNVDPNSQGWMTWPLYEVENYVFDDGTVWTIQQIRERLIAQSQTSGNDSVLGFDNIDDTLEGGAGNDALNGGTGNDTYVFKRGDGIDTITDSAEQNVLLFHNLDRENLRVALSGTDVVLSFSDAPGDSVRIIGQQTPRIVRVTFDDGASLNARELRDLAFTQLATAGNDAINGTAVAETLLLSSGSDRLTGGGGDDIYLRPAGVMGTTIIRDGGGFDTLKLAGYLSSQVGVTVSGVDLVLTLPDGEVRLERHLHSSTADVIERIEFADGQVWELTDITSAFVPTSGTAGTINGTIASETVNGTAAADTIDGKEGNDLLRGAGGSDLYLFGAGSGNDTITEAGSNVRFDIDRIQMVGLNPDDIYGTRVSATVVTFTIKATGETLTINGQFGDSSAAVEYMKFANGTVWNVGKMRAEAWWRGTAGDDYTNGTGGETFVGGAGNDYVFSGQNTDETYIFTPGDGQDEIEDFYGVNDTVVLHGVSRSDIWFEYGRPYGDLIIHYSPTDSLLVTRQLSKDSFYLDRPGQGIEFIKLDDGTVIDEAEMRAEAVWAGTDGDDQIFAPDDFARISGRGGDDFILGGRGDTTYLWRVGDGNDLIQDYEDWVGIDTIRMQGVSLSQVQIRVGNWGEISVTYGATGDSIRFERGVELLQLDDVTLYTADITATTPLRTHEEDVYGSNHADLIEGSAGDDFIEGRSGNDRYLWRTGDGNDIIREYDWEGEADVLVLSDLNREDVVIARGRATEWLSTTNTSGVEITVLSTGEVISLKDQLVGGPAGIERIEFANGDILNLADLDFGIVRGGDGDEDVVGGSKDETLEGGLGDDTLHGETGSDRYLWKKGDGDDHIWDHRYREDVNTLVLLDVDLDDVDIHRASGTSGDMGIRILSTDEEIRVEGQFAPPEADFWGIRAQGISAIQFADGTVLTSEEIATIVDASDTIIGSDGDDTLDGAAGNDVLAGGDGNDNYVFDRGYAEDTVTDSGGDNDFIVLGAGILPELIMPQRDGDDLLIEVAGQDRLSLRISNQFSEYGEEGIEGIRFADGTVWTLDDIKREILRARITSGDDVIDGFDTADIIRAGGGNDTINAGLGEDYIDGGKGIDTVVLDAWESDYEITVVGNKTILTDLWDYGGTKTLANVEKIVFSYEETTVELEENQAPVIQNAITRSTQEDRATTILASDLIATGHDPDASNLTLVSVQGAVNGTVALNADGDIVFTPASNFSGGASFTYILSDGELTVVGQANLNVSPVNDAPVVGAALLHQAVDEDGSLSFQIPVDAFVDADGDALTRSATLADGSTLPNWIVFDAIAGSFQVDPPHDFNGEVSVRITATDGAETIGRSFNLIVNPANDTPVVLQAIADITLAGGAVVFDVPEQAFADIDGDALVLTATLENGDALPDWLSFSPELRSFAGVSPAGFTGTLNIRVVASDGLATASDVFALTLTDANRAPVVSTPELDRVFAEDGGVSFSLAAGQFSDPDGDDLDLSVSLADGSALPDWLTFNAETRTFSGQPPANWNGSHDVKVTASDGTKEISDTFRITIAPENDAPHLVTPVPTFTTPENSLFSIPIPPGTFGDLDGDALTIDVTFADGRPLSDRGWSYNSETGLISGFQLYSNFNGTIPVKLIASDGQQSVEHVFNVVVTAVNDAPEVTGGPEFVSANETEPFSLSWGESFYDADGDALTFSGKLVNGDPLPAWLSLDPVTGVLSGTPTTSASGTYRIVIAASDGVASVEEGFWLTVLDSDRVPVIANPIEAQAVDEDTAWTFTVPDNTFDPRDTDVLTLSARLKDGSPLPAWLSFDAGTHTFSGTPPADFNGVLDLVVIASDERSSVETGFTLTISPVNDAPVAASDPENVAGMEEAAVSGQLLAGSDVEGNALSLELVSGSEVGGTVSIDAQTGAYVFTPATNFNGTAGFSYLVNDGVAASASKPVTLIIAPVNDVPVAAAAPETAVGFEDMLIPGGILAASDADGDALTYEVVPGSVVGGSVHISSASRIYVFTPDPDFNGAASFSYTVSDGIAASAPKAVSLWIYPVNDAPEVAAEAETASGLEDQPVNGALLAGFDADGDEFTFNLVTGSVVGGSVTIDAETGAYHFVPLANFNGEASFRYVLNDGSADSAEKAVTVNLAVVNDEPVLVPDTGSAGENETKTFNLVANDNDPDGEQLRLTMALVTAVAGLALAPSQAQAAFSVVNGNLAFTPGTLFDGLEAGQTATVTLSYTATDDQGGTVSSTFTLTVQGAADGLTPTIVGTNGSDNIYGTNGLDIIDGRGGNDDIDGRSGNDTIFGGSGNDDIWGKSGNDTLHGDSGDDDIWGGDGNDIVFGGAGNDEISGNGGHDHLDGGDGDDVIEGGSGDDELVGSAGNDWLYAGVMPEDGDDDGDDDDDFDAGENVLDGGSGNDRLYGGSDHDVLTGGTGNDVLDGGGGADRFVFASGFGWDFVKDFRAGTNSGDVIEFQGVFGGFSEMRDSAFQLGDNVVIVTDLQNILTLEDVRLSQLHTSDFHFA